MTIALTESDLSLTGQAVAKMTELFNEVEEGIQGVRVYAAPGGCSGVSFGMTFTESIAEDDGVREFDAFKIVVDDDTIDYLRGVEIDFVDQGDGNATFVFNNLPKVGGGCGTCGSTTSGGGCS